MTAGVHMDVNNTIRGVFNDSTLTLQNAYDRSIRHSETIEFEKLIRIIIPIIFGCIVLLGVSGNLMVIFTVLSRRERSITDTLIFNLACADLSFVIICVPFTAYNYCSISWAIGNFLCKISSYFIYVSVYVSIYTLVLMAVSRYLAIVHPISSLRYRTSKNTFIALAVVWVFTLAGNAPLLSQYDIIHYEYFTELRSVCTNDLHTRSRTASRLFFTIFFIIGFTIPLLFICVLYGLILRKLLFYKAPVAASGNQRTEIDRLKAQKKASKMVLIVIIVFGVCWMPNHVMFMIQEFGNYSGENFWIILAISANSIAYLNSCVNPIIYAFLSSKFRRSFKRMICMNRNEQHQASMPTHQSLGSSYRYVNTPMQY